MSNSNRKVVAVGMSIVALIMAITGYPAYAIITLLCVCATLALNEQ